MSPIAEPLGRPFIGHGIGLRVRHYSAALSGELDVDWVEVISENFFGRGGRPRAVLERLKDRMPVVLHGVSLGLGSADTIDVSYLQELKRLVDWLRPPWVSDHLCWTSFGGHHSHDLLPLPHTEEALRRVTRNATQVQDYLDCPLLLENVSSYVAYQESEMPEWEFLSAAARNASCRILLDLNNIVVNAKNHAFDANAYVAAIPADLVWQFHLANHDDLGTHKIDSHRGSVPDEVWALYCDAIRRFGSVSSLIEWDEDVPDLEVLRAEQRKAKALTETRETPSRGRP